MVKDVNWVQERDRLLHDWPKSQFILGLGHFANVVADLVEDLSFREQFFKEILPKWSEHREDALRLAESFEQQMSPRRLFEEEPLRSIPELRDPSIIGLIHDLWASRIRPRGKADRVRQTIREADRKYSQLAALGDYPDDINTRADITAALTAFRKACRDLNDAIAEFPATVALL